MSTTVKIEGLKELAAALRELPKAVAARQLRTPVAIAARVIRDDARRRAPVASGRLRQAIIHKRAEGDSLVAQYIVAVRHGKRFQHVGKSDSNQDAYYWTFLEFGTSKMAAEPFMRPAYEANKNDALTIIVEGLRVGVESEAVKLAWRTPR